MALTKIPRGLLDTGIADSSDATAITIAANEDITLAGHLHMGSGKDITAPADLILDVVGNIKLDADGGNVYFDDAATSYGLIFKDSTGLAIRSVISDGDFKIQGNDGGSTINALTFDMSAAGAATFNSGVTLSGHLDIAYGGGNITWGTNYPAIGNIKSSQATLLGNNIKAGSANNTIVRHAHGSDAGNFIALTYNKGVTFHTGITTTQNSEVAETTNERMRINTSGYVGIGTTTPSGQLVVAASNGGNGIETQVTTHATNKQFILAYDRANSAYLNMEISALNFGIATNNGTTRMHINSSGYVGIGAAFTSPAKALHIKGGSWNTAGITLERTDVGGSNDPGITFKSAAGANDAYGLGSMWFQNALDDNAYAMIRARTDDNTGTSGRLEFVTSTGVVGNGTAATMTIDSTGAVSTPQQPRMVKSRSAAGNQTIANNTATNVDWHGNESTVGVNYTSSGSETGEFSVVEAGLYLINAYARFQTTSTGFNSYLSLHHKPSGSGFSEIAYDYVASSRSYQQMNINRAKNCAAGDTFRVQIWHNQGGDLAVTGNASSTAISVIKVA